MEKNINFNSQLNSCNHVENIELFCIDCNIFLCRNCCKKKSHLEHNKELYELVIEKYSEKIENLLMQGEKILNNTVNFSDAEQEICNKLDEVFQKLITNLKMRHEEMKINCLNDLKIKEVINERKKIEKKCDVLKKEYIFFISDEYKANKKFILEKIFECKIDEQIKHFEILANISNRILQKINNFCNKDIKFELKPNVYKDFFPNFSESEIINNTKEINFVLKNIKKLLNNKICSKFQLLFQASKDGFTALDFHKKCDGRRPLLVIVENEFKKKFGGFVDASFYFSKEEVWKACKDFNAFLFSIDRKTIHKIIDRSKAIQCDKNFGPIFGSGCDLFISSDCNKNTLSGTYLGKSYELPNNIEPETTKSKNWLSGSDNGKFRVVNYEVWHCI